MVVFGLGSLKEDKSKKAKDDAKKGSSQAEAQAILKRMNQKKESGDCPFC